HVTGALDLDPVRPELMFRPAWTEASAPDVLSRTTVVCGCGGGDAVRALLPRLFSLAGRLGLDADALNATAADARFRPPPGAAARGCCHRIRSRLRGCSIRPRRRCRPTASPQRASSQPAMPLWSC